METTPHRGRLLPESRKKILEEWNSLRPRFPETSAIHHLFEARAGEEPDAEAVRRDGASLTYAELDSRANRIAHCLQEMGVGPDVRVGISVSRTTDLIAAVLGILKAGGAYIPLDPSYPRERLAAMLEDAKPPVLVVTTANIAYLPEAESRLFDLEAEAEHIAAQTETAPVVSLVPQNLAYMIFTSGSTGRPKGTMVSHGALINYYYAMAHEYALTPDLRHLDMTSFSFDVFTGNWTRALSSGGTLVLCERERLLDARWLYGLMKEERIGYADFVPAVFRPLLRFVRESGLRFDFMRYLVLGSEAWFAREYDQGLALMGEGARFLNTYGVTETTIETTFFDRSEGIVEGMGLSPEANVPIGRPFANQTLFILDRDLEPVDVGEDGELYIGGAGLARGYEKRPGLTAERFLPHPFATEPGERVYKSGDLTRYREDGTVEFINRADHQIKIRGFRVELGEIEAAAAGQPGVADAVVVYREDHGLKHLVAYLIPSEGAEIETYKVREHLELELPEYMVPTAYVVMQAFPLTPNGKVDRKNLPSPAGGRPELDIPLVPPRNPVEERIAEIWVHYLGIEDIGVLDNLIELGGHSLIATQIVVCAREVFNADIKLAHFLREPTIAKMAEMVDIHSGEQRLPPVPIVSRDGHLPLAYPQELIWFLTQMYPESVAYNFQMIMRFRGPLNIPALAKTLTEIVRRHEILHCNFVKREGVPSMAVRQPFTVTLPPIDLRTLPAGEREARARAIGDAMFREIFDIENDQLIRWKLVRLADDHHMLLHQEHHMVHDGWTVKVFLGEINALYRAFCEGRPSPLPDLPIQMADYAAWQHNYMSGSVLAEKVDYWRRKLAGCSPNTYLPLDFPRPDAQTFEGNEIVDAMPADLYADLKEFSRLRGHSLFTTVLAAFELLLWRYTGQEDQVIGSAVTNRQTPEAEQLIGMLVNTIVIRVQMRPDMTWLAFMDVVRKAMLDSFEHQDMPFELLIRNLDLPERDVSRNPLTQVMFGFHDSPVPEIDMPGLDAELIYLDNKTAKMDLNVTVIPRSQQGFARGAAVTDDANTFHWEWNTALFRESTIRRMIAQYHTILRTILKNDEIRLDDIQLDPDAERVAVVDHADAQDRERGSGTDTLHGLFASAARGYGDRRAVSCDGDHLTYAELNESADRLAARLIAAGATGGRVSVLLERGLHSVVALLGTLKAGAVYVPIDPALPESRQALMAEGSAVILCQTALGGVLPEIEARRIMIDDPRQVDEDVTLPTVSPDQTAYVIFTSGSTGEPKGVCVAHAPAADHMKAIAETFGLTDEDVTLQFASHGFDVSLEQILAPLMNGARVVLRGKSVWTPEELADHIVADGLTVINLTPLYLTQWLREPYCMERLGDLRLVIAGGDALHPDVIARWRSLGSPFRLINAYGPTEAIITPCAYEVPAEPAGREGASVPIGSPVGGRLALVLDARGSVVPIGVPGELCLGAPLATGYLDDAEKTAAAFTTSERAAPGRRLYRTGDRVRLLEDGVLEYLGRIDRQVKLRGYRIELDEIERSMSALPSVNLAAVRVWGEGESRFIAGYASGTGLEPERLKRHLEERLPGYMVPATLSVLDEIPTTATGKIDRGKLPEPERVSLGGSVPPRTTTEEILAGIWAEALGLPSVGALDNFFELGGHSLLATRALSRINQAFGIQFSLRYFFTNATVQSMAGVIDRMLVGETREDPIPRLSHDKGLPLSFSQRRLWFLDQMDPASTTYNMGGSLRLRGPLSADALSRAVDAVVRRQASLRTTFRLEGEEPVQVINGPSEGLLGHHDLTDLPEDQREAAAVALYSREAGEPFDLATGPLVRFDLVRLGEEDHVLMILMHHIITDGWSNGILHKELGAAYRAALEGTSANLPELPIQYPDFAAWQNERMRGPLLERQLGYWRGRLNGELPVLELPTDHPPRVIHSREGRDYEAHFGPGLAEAFKGFAVRNNATLFMSLLAAFKIFLYRYTHLSDVIVGTPVTNRNRPELEHLIG